MRTPTFITIVAWLLLSFNLGLSHARPATPESPTELAPRFAGSSYEVLTRSTVQSRELGIADIPACGVRTFPPAQPPLISLT